MTVILGIDPGSSVTGYGVLREDKRKLAYIASGLIRIKKSFLSDKLQQIYKGIREIMHQYQPEEIAIETVFMQKNVQSAIKLGQARGVAIVAATLEGIQIAEYSPRQIKQAVTGYGAAEKRQIQQMVCRLLKLSDVPPEDAADALAIAICHANTRKSM